MKIRNLIACFTILVVCLINPVWSSVAQSEEECRDLKISSEVSHTSSNQKDGKVKVTASGGQAPYHYIFYYESGHLVTKDVTRNSLEQLGQGTFYCSVVDAKGCTKKIKIDIK
jgi:hypothetical protein